ncbi:hypothetical protein [Streptomyces mirabilis]|uniref:hypothetical protein n=1 Tax=Streptomyces mirabilis TaxID=68239 RepID=UPI0032E35EF1
MDRIEAAVEADLFGSAAALAVAAPALGAGPSHERGSTGVVLPGGTGNGIWWGDGNLEGELNQESQGRLPLGPWAINSLLSGCPWHDAEPCTHQLTMVARGAPDIVATA